MDLQLTYAEIGLLMGFQHLITVLLEFPSGILADWWGRRSATALCFVFYGVSFAGFAAADWRGAIPLFAWFGGCLTFFALGEALRTGSHKAIMLDYLDSNGQENLATQVIGRTRAVSKYSSGVAAVCGGILLTWTRDYAWLFYLSAASAGCGFLLMLTYPRELEGDVFRERQSDSGASAPAQENGVLWMWRQPGFFSLLMQSVLFESQTKITLKYFTQPFLKAGLHMFGVSIIAPLGVTGLAASGALWVGLSEFARDSLGGLGARLSSGFEKRTNNRFFALNRIFTAGFVAVLLLAACTWDLRWGLFPGLFLLFALTILQNLRRPIFVSTLNTRMAKRQRASVLSLESFVRAVTVAALLPLIGLAADAFDLVAVWAICSAILALGFCFRLDGESLNATDDNVRQKTSDPAKIETQN